MSACTAYRVVEIKQNPNYLLPPHISKSKMKKLLQGKKPLRIRVNNALIKENGNTTGDPAPSISLLSGSKEINIGSGKSCVTFRINSRIGDFKGKKLPILFELDYTAFETNGRFDSKKLASFTDELKAFLDRLDGGIVFKETDGGPIRLTLKTSKEHRSYQLLDEVYQQFPIPADQTLAKYSYRTDNDLTYIDLIPGMYIRSEKGSLKGNVIVWQEATNYQVTRNSSEQVMLSPYARSFRTLNIGPASNVAQVGNIMDASTTNKAAKYMGLITPAEFRPSAAVSSGPCFVTSTDLECNQTVILGTDFSTYRTTILPTYHNCTDQLNLAVLANCSNATCWKFNITANERIGLTPFIMIITPYNQERIIELGTSKGNYESGFGESVVVLRRYKKRYPVIRNAPPELKLHLFDQLKFK